MDGAGRLDVLTYPEARLVGAAAGTGKATRVRYTYNGANGALSSVIDADDASKYYWQSWSRDDQGHITQEQFGGNAVTTRTWDAQRGWLKSINTTSKVAGVDTVLQDATYAYSPGGLMKSRSDNNAPGGALFETFQYDSLNRLRWWCVKDIALSSNECAQAQFGVGYTFADNGNLTERRTFVNGAKNTPVENIAFTYPAAGQPQAHAVTQRAWTVGTGAGATFTYDTAGRQWQRPGQVVTYNSNDLPEKIVSGSATTTYLYDADGTRYQKKSVVNANLTRTTTYASGLYELREEVGTAASQQRTHVYYISAGNTVLAQLTRKEPDLSELTPEYLHNDHLGTVSFTTSAAGVASTKVRTDPYGNRFDPTKAPRLDTPPPAAITGVTRGYTGHEMEVDDLGVINMKGRIFDPINGRFNSPDPLVQAPQFSQSYNRYMYVMGDPAGATDPTGYQERQQGEYYSDPNGGVHYYDGGAEAYNQMTKQLNSSFAQAWAEAAANASGDSGDRGKNANQWDEGMKYFRSSGLWGLGAESGKMGSEQQKLDDAKTATAASTSQTSATDRGQEGNRAQNGVGTTTLHIQVFAPFKVFGQNTPGFPEGFKGDDRTFGTNPEASSRIRVEIEIADDASSATLTTSESDPSFRADSLGGVKGDPATTMLVTRNTSGALELGIHVAGSNPLVLGAPEIDVHLQVTVTPTKEGPELHGTLSGDAFPNTEVFTTGVRGPQTLINFETSGDQRMGPAMLLPMDFRRPMGVF